MKKIKLKKIFGILIVSLFTLIFSACGKKQVTIGVLYEPNITDTELNVKLAKVDRMNPADMKYVFFDDYKSLEQALKNKKINFARVDENLANYMVANNDSLETIFTPSTSKVDYGICFDEENIVVINEINDALRKMKKDGTIEKIVKEYIEDVIDAGDPEIEEFPVLDTDINMAIGITGDIPPIDWKDEKGHGIGFNQKLLTELSKRLNINVKTVAINSKDRFNAIKENKCDGVFYAKTYKTPDAVLKYRDIPKECLASESYLTSSEIFVYNSENSNSVSFLEKFK